MLMLSRQGGVRCTVTGLCLACLRHAPGCAARRWLRAKPFAASAMACHSLLHCEP